MMIKHTLRRLFHPSSSLLLEVNLCALLCDSSSVYLVVNFFLPIVRLALFKNHDKMSKELATTTNQLLLAS